jgi:hypothetical protein
MTATHTPPPPPRGSGWSPAWDGASGNFRMFLTGYFPCGKMQVKHKYCNLRPYGEWLKEHTVMLEDIIASVPPVDVPRPLGAVTVAPASGGSANGNGAYEHSNGANGKGNGAALNGVNGNGIAKVKSPPRAMDNHGIRSILKPLKVCHEEKKFRNKRRFHRGSNRALDRLVRMRCCVFFWDFARFGWALSGRS